MKKSMIAIISAGILLVAGCAQKNVWIPVGGEQAEKIAAPIVTGEGEKIGEVSMIETADGVTIDIMAENLPPGLHGTHIHEKGECAPPDFESAGAHFNPTNKEHGFDNRRGYHLGDLPNLEVGADGTVDVSLTTADLSLKQNMKNSILDHDGSALIIHADPDDYETDPSGNSGDRIACAALIK